MDVVASLVGGFGITGTTQERLSDTQELVGIIVFVIMLVALVALVAVVARRFRGKSRDGDHKGSVEAD